MRLSKDLGIDPKSVFHFIKVPQSLGIVKKFTDVDDGCRTNRIVHVRYLEQSVAWRTHIAAEEPEELEGEGGAGAGAAGGVKDEDGEGAAGAGGDWSGLEMPPISPAYLDSNVPLIRTRIVKAIRRRKDQWIPHIELHGSIVRRLRPLYRSPLPRPSHLALPSTPLSLLASVLLHPLAFVPLQHLPSCSARTDAVSPLARRASTP